MEGKQRRHPVPIVSQARAALGMKARRSSEARWQGLVEYCTYLHIQLAVSIQMTKQVLENAGTTSAPTDVPCACTSALCTSDDTWGSCEKQARDDKG